MPSLKVHFATSASGEVEFSTASLLERLVKNSAKLGSLIKCQTAASGASMTALSRTPEEVGMLDMVVSASSLIGCDVWNVDCFFSLLGGFHFGLKQNTIACILNENSLISFLKKQ